MPDSATDLTALTAQMTALRGDLNRRFEQSSARFDELSGRIEQLDRRMTLDTRIDDLNVRINTVGLSRKVSLPFSATLDGTWIGGTTNPPATLPLPDVRKEVPVAIGKMLVALPNLSRIAGFRASFSFLEMETVPGTADLSFISTTNISLQRVALGEFVSEPVVELSRFHERIVNRQGLPIAGRELVDNDLFTYSIAAEFLVPNSSDGALPRVVPEAMCVMQTFQVDCIVA